MYAYYNQSISQDKILTIKNGKDEIVKQGYISKDIDYIFYTSSDLNENYKLFISDLDGKNENQYTFTFGNPINGADNQDNRKDDGGDDGQNDKQNDREKDDDGKNRNPQNNENNDGDSTKTFLICFFSILISLILIIILIFIFRKRCNKNKDEEDLIGNIDIKEMIES